jgi:glucosyl-dolichyl phosphate glucuronosyltransferase
MIFSVVICTYNRAALLSTAIDTLVKQSLDSSLYEIIVVDNNSTDNTKDVVLSYGEKVKYFLEKKVGLSHARNRGYEEAKGDYVGYTDDDCELPVHWLSTMYEVTQSVGPAMTGGPVYPFYLPDTKPNWYKDEYMLKEYGQIARPLLKGEYLIGCNFFVRKDLFEKIGEFHVDYGMTGKKIGYAEETELQERMRSIAPGEIIYYNPLLFVKHLVRPEQMTMSWIIRSFYSKGRNNFLLRNKEGLNSSFTLRTHGIIQLVFISVTIIAHTLYGFLFRIRRKYPSFQNYFYDRVQGHVKKLGYYSRQIGY